MSDESELERQLREVLSQTEPLTLQGLEDEIMSMLARLYPLPIRMKRVQGMLFSEERVFLDANASEKAGRMGKDTAYRWDVRSEKGEMPPYHKVSQPFVMALWTALEYRTKKLQEAREIALSDLTFLEADRRKGNISEEEYRLVFDSIMKR